MKKQIGIVSTWIAGGAVVLLAAGCANQAPKNYGTDLSVNLEEGQVRAVLNQQEASGAREESTLRPQHFDGPGLSSLGTAELDEILADSHSCNPLVIYLDVPSDSYTQDRRTAVSRYLTDKGGLKTEQIEFHQGVNPATFAPVEDNVANYARTDSSNGQAGSGSASAGSSSSSSSASH